MSNTSVWLALFSIEQSTSTEAIALNDFLVLGDLGGYIDACLRSQVLKWNKLTCQFHHTHTQSSTNTFYYRCHQMVVHVEFGFINFKHGGQSS